MKYYQASIRNIGKLQYNTPLLVPSFSSKGFPHLKELHSFINEKLTDISLLSTYDLHYGYLDEAQIYESEIILLDSGGYERNQEHDISEIYGSQYIPKEWNESLYLKQIKMLQPITDVLVVSFDNEKPYPIKVQIDKALENFKIFPQFATDFLCKPILDKNKFIDIDNLLENMNLIKPFDVIGFTEKELGDSVLERAENIYRIRKAMSNLEMHKPIHIFGCLDPLSIILYFLCGADIFDGLSWLRFAFKKGTPTYINHHAINSGLWERQDNEVKLISYVENLEVLSNLKQQLINFTETKDWKEFDLIKDECIQIDLILEKIGMKYE
jgi:hypothetical protein